MKTISLVITSLFLLSTFTFAETNLVYSITLNYDGTLLTQDSIRLIEGVAPERLNQPDNGFTLRVIDFNGNTLHSFRFLIETRPIRDPPSNIFDENGTQVIIPETEQIQETKTVLIAPYFPNAKSIQIYDDKDILKLSIDVSKYSKQSLVIEPLYLGIGILAVALLAGFFFMKNHNFNISVKKKKRK